MKDSLSMLTFKAFEPSSIERPPMVKYECLIKPSSTWFKMLEHLKTKPHNIYNLESLKKIQTKHCYFKTLPEQAKDNFDSIVFYEEV